MAFYNQDEEDQQNPEQQGAAQNAPSGSGLISGGSSGSSPNTPQAAGSPDKPGNFVGLKDYLNANKPQAAKLGDQVAGNVQGVVAGAQGELGGLGDKFKQEADKGQISNIGTGQQEAEGIIGKTSALGAGQKLSDEDKSRFGQIAGAQYQGPNQLSDTSFYQPAAQKVSDAQKTADLTKSEPGTQQLLSNIFNQPNYTTGEKRFDNYLLKSKDTQDKLAAARAPAAQFQSQLDTANQGATDYATQQKATADKLREQVSKALGTFDDPTTPQNEAAGALGNYQNQVGGQLATKQSDLDQLTQRMKSNTLNDQDRQTLGVPDLNSYGVGYDNYFNAGTPSLAGVTTPEQQAQYQALLDLGGTEGNPLYGGAAPGEFGAYKPTFNTGAYSTAVDTAKGAYGADTKSLLEAVNKPWGFDNISVGGSNTGNVQDAANFLNSQIAANSQNNSHMSTVERNHYQALLDQLSAMQNKYQQTPIDAINVNKDRVVRK